MATTSSNTCKWCERATEKKFSHKPGKGTPQCFCCEGDTKHNGYDRDGNPYFRCKDKECDMRLRWHTYWYYDHLNAMADYFEAGQAVTTAAQMAGVNQVAAKQFLIWVVGYWQHPEIAQKEEN